MTTFQLLMLGASAFFAFKIYEHIQTLQDPEAAENKEASDETRSADAFSVFSPESLIIRADESFKEGDLQKSLALLTEANAKAKNNPDVLFKIGYILQQLNDNDEALTYYKEALELDKKNDYIHNSIASIYRANGEFISAKMHLNESLAIDSQNAITYYNYGNLLVDMNHPDEAIEMYKRAIEINPEFAEAKEELDKLS